MPWRACCRETGTAGTASGLGKRTESNPDTAPQADSTKSNPRSQFGRFRIAILWPGPAQVSALEGLSATPRELPLVTVLTGTQRARTDPGSERGSAGRPGGGAGEQQGDVIPGAGAEAGQDAVAQLVQ
jgi:hypothetical protein